MKMKMKIYSIHYNKPEYIKLQKESLDKHIKIDYEFIIVDNSIDDIISSKILEISSNLNIRYIKCNNIIKEMSSKSHQNSFKYILNH